MKIYQGFAQSNCVSIDSLTDLGGHMNTAVHSWMSKAGYTFSVTAYTGDRHRGSYAELTIYGTKLVRCFS
jgi:hypothetical protein